MTWRAKLEGRCQVGLVLMFLLRLAPLFLFDWLEGQLTHAFPLSALIGHLWLTRCQGQVWATSAKVLHSHLWLWLCAHLEPLNIIGCLHLAWSELSRCLKSWVLLGHLCRAVCSVADLVHAFLLNCWAYHGSAWDEDLFGCICSASHWFVTHQVVRLRGKVGALRETSCWFRLVFYGSREVITKTTRSLWTIVSQAGVVVTTRKIFARFLSLPKRRYTQGWVIFSLTATENTLHRGSACLLLEGLGGASS